MRVRRLIASQFSSSSPGAREDGVDGPAADVLRVGEQVTVRVHCLRDRGVAQACLNNPGVEIGRDERRGVQEPPCPCPSRGPCSAQGADWYVEDASGKAKPSRTDATTGFASTARVWCGPIAGRLGRQVPTARRLGAGGARMRASAAAAGWRRVAPAGGCRRCARLRPATVPAAP